MTDISHRSVIVYKISLKYIWMYKLSRVIQAHKRDARCLDYLDGLLITGGSDKVCSIYQYQQGNYSHINSLTLEA